MRKIGHCGVEEFVTIVMADKSVSKDTVQFQRRIVEQASVFEAALVSIWPPFSVKSWIVNILAFAGSIMISTKYPLFLEYIYVFI